ncbi:MAG: hypothetical protein ISS45_04910 [Candidatus Omnitrophica bacterium]|nr:hypothetical protein [Candidatus Omnitrophota bacterium]
MFIILAIGFMHLPLALGQREERGAIDERAIIKEKIKELGKIIKEHGSGDFEKEKEDLKKLEEIVSVEDQKARQKRIEEKDSRLTQEAVDMQQDRIRQIEENVKEEFINESLLSPERLKEIEARFDESLLSPERLKEIEAKLDKEAEYFTCRAALEEDSGMCNKIMYPALRNECYNIFNNTYMLSQIIKNKELTPKALNICRELGGRPNDEDCRWISRACLTGDTSKISTLPYFTGEDNLLGLAFISGDERYCHTIAKEELQNCLDYAAYTAAIRSGDPEGCLKIKEMSLKAICKLYFNRDQDICEELLKN